MQTTYPNKKYFTSSLSYTLTPSSKRYATNFDFHLNFQLGKFATYNPRKKNNIDWQPRAFGEALQIPVLSCTNIWYDTYTNLFFVLSLSSYFFNK